MKKYFWNIIVNGLAESSIIPTRIRSILLKVGGYNLVMSAQFYQNPFLVQGIFLLERKHLLIMGAS